MRPLKVTAFFLLFSIIFMHNACISNKKKHPTCPLIKEIQQSSYQPKCQSIIIFYIELKLLLDDNYADNEKIYNPIVKMLNEYGYNAASGGMIDYYKIIDENKINIFCDDPNEEKGYLKTKTDHTNFFKSLVKRYPQADGYDLIVLCSIDYRRPHGAPIQYNFEVLVYDNRIKTQILKIKHSENELNDVHVPPSGYTFSVWPKTKVHEGIYACTFRGLEKIFSIYPAINGRKKKERPSNYPEAFIYRYGAFDSPLKLPPKEKIKIDTKPIYYKYFR